MINQSSLSNRVSESTRVRERAFGEILWIRGNFWKFFESTNVSKKNFLSCEGKSQGVMALPMSSLPFCY